MRRRGTESIAHHPTVNAGEHSAYAVTDTDPMSASVQGFVGRRSTRAVVASVSIVAAGALLLSGCGLSEARARAQASQAATPLPLDNHWLPGLLLPGAGGAGLQPDKTLNDQQILAVTLQSLLIQPNDFRTNVTIDFLAHGKELAGQPTLDVCSGSFPSELKRQARFQVAAYDNSGKFTGYSSEAVVYGTPADAAQALKEIREAQATCKPGTVAERPPDGKVTYFPANPSSLIPLATKSTMLPIGQRAIDEMKLKLANGSVYRNVSIYQVSGRFLSALYFSSSDDSTVAPALATHLIKTSEALAQRLRDLTKPTKPGSSPTPAATATSGSAGT